MHFSDPIGQRIYVIINMTVFISKKNDRSRDSAEYDKGQGET